MGKIRKYTALFFLALFGWYFSSINLFPHIHIVNGNSIAHSHFGGTSEHGHSEGEYAIIDLLSTWQTEAADPLCGTSLPFYLSDAGLCVCHVSFHVPASVCPAHSLRGPPQV